MVSSYPIKTGFPPVDAEFSQQKTQDSGQILRFLFTS